MKTKHSLSRRILLIVVIGVVALCALRLASCGHGVRVGTYNIRRFGIGPTDMDRLTAIVGATEADVLALQEIQSEEKMKDLARRLSVGGRRYAFRLSACGGRSAIRMQYHRLPKDLGNE